MLMPPVISLVGKSNSGKTTLLEKLLPQLIKHGFRVGVLKHHNHDFEFDIPGKDTWRHKQAGAKVVVLATPIGVGLVRDTDTELSINELVNQYYTDVDIVITEGYKKGPHPKIEVCRQANQKSPINSRDESWKAFVTDMELDTTLPVFDLNDSSALATFIISNFLPPKGTPNA
nr:molybdopterin-guanine dinucleotide biosynthesis protein B [Desulfobulbaceae bacterium]